MRTGRRRFLQASLILSAGAVSGCIGEGDGGANGSRSTDSTSNANESYTVEMVPVGEVEFESVPETWYSGRRNGDWADMGLALGQVDGWIPGPLPSMLYYDDLGFDLLSRFPDARWVNEQANDPERIHEVDPDVILLDPVNLRIRWDWSAQAIEDVERTVGPFFAAMVYRYREELGYEPPTMYEAFEKLSMVFKERERYDAIKGIHDEMLETVKSRLPPEDERPRLGYLDDGTNPQQGEFELAAFGGRGSENKQYHELGPTNAFDIEGGGSEGWVDYEGLLDADPEMIIFQDGLMFGWEFVERNGTELSFNAAAFQERFVTPIENHPIGGQLTAIEENQVYPGGIGEQGPVTNLYNTELLGRQLYPDEFGAFDPEAPLSPSDDEELFDREELYDIIAGE
ncbi:ABC transporter substrate-binding protein [Halococcus sp. IIIV-5B]|uniref:ABC transporter substrate-binding protein n=1 Tax=Halococcus sp. IIIV-5B TaxID=2321230 RepID=UPI0013144971|nr:ABC transporter substrate-binding protein [Halococcus sp. IIIV-5B]